MMPRLGDVPAINSGASSLTAAGSPPNLKGDRALNLLGFLRPRRLHAVRGNGLARSGMNLRRRARWQGLGEV
jgi:hypothetical protein